MKGYGAYCRNPLFEGLEKSEEKFEEKKVYTSDGTNASDLITRVFFNSCKKIIILFITL
jgi:hypothetical protein